MNHPLLYEINTRCWLGELSARAGQPLTLADAPEAELVRWADLGFTHVWLMGVWATGPRSRALALAEPSLRAAFDAALPGWQPADVAGSPYAICGYQVAPALGGEAALKKFRKRLHRHGLRLVLDFIPNHLGLDHPWLTEAPERFVQSPVKAPETFELRTPRDTVWVAHGKDPHFPAWADTAQLDYRRRDTRRAVQRDLARVARLCDGVRCDMAMLVLNEVFAATWSGFPGGLAPAEEFWTEAIAAVKRRHGEFLFLAEVYWGLEAKLQALGFDYTYDKALYDRLLERRAADAVNHLLALPQRVAASAHFLENHDEARVATWLSLPEHAASALLVLGLPGLRLLHEGQLTGASSRTPVHLARRAAEPVNAKIAALYQTLLQALPQSAVGRGEAQLLRARPAWPDNPTAENFVLVQWQAAPPEFDLVVVNLAGRRSQCYVPLSLEGLGRHNWALRDALGHERWERFGADLQEQGLYLDVAAHGAQLFHFEPIR